MLSAEITRELREDHAEADNYQRTKVACVSSVLPIGLRIGSHFLHPNLATSMACFPR